MSDDLSKADNLVPSAHVPQSEGFADGIYFGLRAEDYHADAALGSSGIRDLMISPLRYWVRSPHNPDYVAPEDTEAQGLGTYLHDLLLEGGTKPYAVKPAGMSFSTRAGKDWRDLQEGAGREIITSAQDRTQRTMFKALDITGTRARFTDGEPEVSVFWTEKNGYRCKMRLDYLKAGEALDLKTYSNSMDKDTETAVAHAIASRRISVQAFWYDRGLMAMQAMVRKHGAKCVNLNGQRRAHQLGLCEAVASRDEPLPLFYVFCETGDVPNITARRFASHDDGQLNAFYRWAKQGVEIATQRYAIAMKKFGPERPWIDEVFFKDLTDEEMASAPWVLARD